MLQRVLHRLATVARSAAVGAVATLVDLALLALLIHVATMAPRVASPIALAVGVAIQFVGNKLFAFGDRRRAWGRQLAAFMVVEAGAFALNLAGFDALAVGLGVPSLPARIAVSAAVYAGFCLPLWSLLFRAPRRLVPALGG
jgi:putative flippase GtrA